MRQKRDIKKKNSIGKNIDRKMDVDKGIEPTGPVADRKVICSGGTTKIVLIAILVISIGILLGVTSFTINRIYQHDRYLDSIVSYDEINTSVTITAIAVGLNGDTDSLKFGKVPVGGGGTRFINIKSSQKVLVEIYFSGDTSQFLSVERNRYILEAGTQDKIAININVPGNAETGDYTGKVHIVLRKP